MKSLEEMVFENVNGILEVWILLEIKCNLDIIDKIFYIFKGCIVRVRFW